MSKKEKAPKPEETPVKENNIPDDDDKLDIQKSVLEVNREFQKKRQEEQEKLERKIEEKRVAKEKQKREEYEKKLLEEKKELIRLKQGLIDESETIHEVHEEAVILTPWQKFRNFIYHNKWWLGLAVIFAALAGFLIYNLATKPNPDVIVLVMCNNNAVGNESELEDYVKQFTEDLNHNGKVQVAVYYIPIAEDIYVNFANGSDTKLTTQLESADSVIVIGDNSLMKLFGPDDDVFVDLSESFPHSKHFRNGKFYLQGTDFAKKIGIEDKYITYDMFIAVRKPRKLLYADKDDMQETYDKQFPIVEKIINELMESEE